MSEDLRRSLLRSAFSFEKHKRMDVAVALYHVLRESWMSHLGSENGLLPQLGGWAYSPLWQSPRPSRNANLMGHISPTLSPPTAGRLLKRVISSVVWADGQLGPEYADIARVNQRIMEKAWIMRRRRADAILTHAVEQAKQDLNQSQDVLYALAMEHDKWCLHPSYPAVREGLEAAEAKAEGLKHLQTVRLHWLETWTEIEAGVWKKKPTGLEVSEFTTLISPQDVDDAIEAMQPILIHHPETAQRRIIGHWYATLLLRCGAEWRALRAMREPRDGPRRGNTHRTWYDIADNKRRRYDWGLSNNKKSLLPPDSTK